ncbi:MAG: putative 4-aminobutyrate aminotransferase (GabT) [Candidatus Hinthialibacteria bacterium]
MTQPVQDMIDLRDVREGDAPIMLTESPGPKSLEIWEKECAYISPGLSGSTSTSRLALDEGYMSYLRDVDGNIYIDFSSGVVMTNPGHCHPKVVEAINQQTSRLMNVHDHAVPNRWELCKKLAEITPGNLKRTQLYSGGTETVEAAIRLAKSYTGGTEVYSFWNGFHGKTLGSLGLDGTGFSKGFGPLAPGFHRLPYPNPYRPLVGGEVCSQAGHGALAEKGACSKCTGPLCTDRYISFIEKAIETLSVGKPAAIIAEPIQGAGGTVIPPLDFFKKLKALTQKLGCLLIIDEILTGFGRTGKWWAIEHFGVEPDIMLMGKGMGCGYPVGALISTEEIIKSKPFANSSGGSSSFGGNPMACAAAMANIEVLETEGYIENAAVVGEKLLRKLEGMKSSHPLIGDVRGKGYLITVELVKNRETKEVADAEGKSMFLKMLNKGVLTITPKANLRMAPPLCMTEPVAMKALDIFEEALAETEKEFGYA